ncbi:MAG TPA: PqiC family protein [Dongiaceae bacterium]|nr:PqiC family protein [Dongiaceae bacterium]
MRLPPAFILLGFALLALTGCPGNAPTRLYVLTATTDKPASTSPEGAAIGVGPITLPKYLDRPQIVTRVAANSLDQANLDQWGGDLNDNITRVVATNLSNLLATDRVSLYPWKDGAPVDFQVTMDISRFEQDKDGNAVLNVFWSIVNKDGTMLLMRRSSYTQPAGEPASQSDNARPFDAQAAAMSRDLALLSHDIATAITGLKGS